MFASLGRLLKNSSRKHAAAVAAVCDRRNSIAYGDATLIERRYSAFFSNLLDLNYDPGLNYEEAN